MTSKTLSDSYSKFTIRNAGIRLLPLENKGYKALICKACGADFSEQLSGVEAYIRHIQEKHPQYVKKSMRVTLTIG